MGITYNLTNKLSTKFKNFLRLKIIIKVKIVCFHVIPYIHSHKGFLMYISMTTRTTLFLDENERKTGIISV